VLSLSLDDSARINFVSNAETGLTGAQRAALAEFYTKQLTIPPQTSRRLSEDWFSRVGLRFRIKPRLFVRLMRASMKPVFG
jgi:hypothetical protein